MPAITRNGIDPSAGHCFPPRPTDSANQESVFVNNILGTVVGAHYPTHCCGIPCHDGSASAGSSTVFFENKAVHRIGDAISCGDVSASGSPTVFAGG
jgi:uncharacterized Zn-binding protein involved in type VI secretion